jgi:hypothetical protein
MAKASRRYYDPTPRLIGGEHVDHWKSALSRWTTLAVRDDDGWMVTATCLASHQVKSGTVLRCWFAGYWPEARENIGQWFRDIEDGIYVVVTEERGK